MGGLLWLILILFLNFVPLYLLITKINHALLPGAVIILESILAVIYLGYNRIKSKHPDNFWRWVFVIVSLIFVVIILTSGIILFSNYRAGFYITVIPMLITLMIFPLILLESQIMPIKTDVIYFKFNNVKIKGDYINQDSNYIYLKINGIRKAYNKSKIDYFEVGTKKEGN